MAWGVWCSLFSSFLLSHFIYCWVLFCLLVNNSLFESVSGMVYRWSSYASFTPHVTTRVKPGFVVKVAIIKKINLAKFGYILEQNRILLCFWLLTGTYHQNLADFELFSLKSGQFESFSPWHEKILCIGWNHIFQVKIWWKLASKTNAGWSSIHTGTLTCLSEASSWPYQAPKMLDLDWETLI